MTRGAIIAIVVGVGLVFYYILYGAKQQSAVAAATVQSGSPVYATAALAYQAPGVQPPSFMSTVPPAPAVPGYTGVFSGPPVAPAPPATGVDMPSVVAGGSLDPTLFYD